MRIKHEESKVGIRIKPEPVDDYDSGWLLSRENVKVVPDAFKTEGEGSQLASRVSDIQIKAEAIEGSIHDKLSRGERPREYAANVKSEEKAVAPGGLVPAASHRKYEHTRAGHRPSSTSQNRHSSQRFDELRKSSLDLVVFYVLCLSLHCCQLIIMRGRQRGSVRFSGALIRKASR